VAVCLTFRTRLATCLEQRSAVRPLSSSLLGITVIKEIDRYPTAGPRLEDPTMGIYVAAWATIRARLATGQVVYGFGGRTSGFRPS